MNYTEEELKTLIAGIGKPDARAMDEARKRQAELAKPPGSLGRLEWLGIRLAGITGRVHNTLEKRDLLVFCADNGVVEEGVSSAPKSVTLAQTVNLSRGKTGGAVLARRFGCRLRVCDVGVDAEIREPGVIPRKIARGTRNLAKEPAMTREEAVRAILTGAELVRESVRDGAKAVGIGEMGIGNTTTSSAVLSVLTGLDAELLTGRGGGLTDAGFEKKISVIREAIARMKPDPSDVPDVLSKVGGLDLCAMTGAFLGAAHERIPAVIDGFISVVAALCAFRMCSDAGAYMIPSHASREIGYKIASEELGLPPLFDLEMRLGEGSGVPVAMTILDAACAVMNEMATFPEAGIDDGYLDPIRADPRSLGEETEGGR
ncbi:MAG: nicotinate-nucleotide--dimethylbenzimidazole phosphoribosyltransferase [Clostridia bacterium]|nr:nicotinate-nucleotide--dimethylbenzimidazole phosphoribosyltransferase [Clostridia bacterium]